MLGSFFSLKVWCKRVWLATGATRAFVFIDRCTYVKATVAAAPTPTTTTREKYIKQWPGEQTRMLLLLHANTTDIYHPSAQQERGSGVTCVEP